MSGELRLSRRGDRLCLFTRVPCVEVGGYVSDTGLGAIGSRAKYKSKYGPKN